MSKNFHVCCRSCTIQWFRVCSLLQSHRTTFLPNISDYLLSLYLSSPIKDTLRVYEASPVGQSDDPLPLAQSIHTCSSHPLHQMSLGGPRIILSSLSEERQQLSQRPCPKIRNSGNAGPACGRGLQPQLRCQASAESHHAVAGGQHGRAHAGRQHQGWRLRHH